MYSFRGALNFKIMRFWFLRFWRLRLLLKQSDVSDFVKSLVKTFPTYLSRTSLGGKKIDFYKKADKVVKLNQKLHFLKSK
jgi:hypothetical protein